MTAQEIADASETDTIATYERWQSWRQEWALQEIEARIAGEGGWRHALHRVVSLLRLRFRFGIRVQGSAR